MRRLRFFLTPVGVVVLVIALAGLIRSLINRNSYEIVLACAVLLLLLVLGGIGRWKSQKLKSQETGWSTPFPMTANASLVYTADDTQHQTLVTGLFASIPIFFRLHFSVKGNFFPAGSAANLKKGCPVLVETSIPRGETQAQLPLDFPMSGVFQGKGICQLRDIFGFFSFLCGQPQQKTVKVRSAPCFGKKPHVIAFTGAEDRKNKPAADIERYYMREYTPGDRFRDINWKSSEKINALITRISTDNQEKVNRLEVHFRNYGPGLENNKQRAKGKEQIASLDSLWMLDRAKARLSYFLRNLMEQNSSFIFDVRSAENSWEIENMDDLDSFFEDLAGISFSPVQNETDFSQGAGDVYVFSTACDINLSAFIAGCNPRPINLFLIQPGTPNDKEIEFLHINDFLIKGCMPFPGWFIRRKMKPLSAFANRAEMFYAGIKP
jgi:hypothetical protein